MYFGGLCCRSIYLDAEAKFRPERTLRLPKPEDLFKILHSKILLLEEALYSCEQQEQSRLNLNYLPHHYTIMTIMPAVEGQLNTSIRSEESGS